MLLCKNKNKEGRFYGLKFLQELQSVNNNYKNRDIVYLYRYVISFSRFYLHDELHYYTFLYRYTFSLKKLFAKSFSNSTKSKL